MSQSLASFIRNTLPKLKFVPLIFLDADNYSRGVESLIARGPNCSEYHAILFIGKLNNSSYVTKLSTYTWCSIVRAQCSVKDAADHCISSVAILANELISCDVPFHLMSLDRFIEELIANLTELQPNRKIIWHTPDTFGLLAYSTVLTIDNLTKKITWYISETSRIAASPNKETSIITTDDPVTGTHTPQFELQFLLYVNILNKEYVAKGQIKPLLSAVGALIKKHGIPMERSGLKPFTAEAIRLGLIMRHGELGTSYIELFPNRIRDYLGLMSSISALKDLNDPKKPSSVESAESVEEFESRFLLYVGLLNSEFVATNQLTPLLSRVGAFVKSKISIRANDLKLLTAEAIKLELITRHGSLGTAYIQIFPDRINDYLAWAATEKKC